MQHTEDTYNYGGCVCMHVYMHLAFKEKQHIHMYDLFLKVGKKIFQITTVNSGLVPGTT